MTKIEPNDVKYREMDVWFRALQEKMKHRVDGYNLLHMTTGFIAYKELSERVEKTLNKQNMLGRISQEDKNEIIEKLGYTIVPDSLFKAILAALNESRTFTEAARLFESGIQSINDSSRSHAGVGAFYDLFSHLNLNAHSLFDSHNTAYEFMHLIEQCPIFAEKADYETKGLLFMYLIEQFSNEQGRKGLPVTPLNISRLIAKIATMESETYDRVYDPVCGSGSLLLNVAKEAHAKKIYAQEVNLSSYNLARMNMIMNDISYSAFDVVLGDVLENPKHMNQRFDLVVGAPPFGTPWNNRSNFWNDERFVEYGTPAPKSKTDFAFVQHMIYQLDDAGKMVVVLPIGILFRGGYESVIRKYLIETNNLLDAVIILPSNLLFTTAIPCCILIFKKNRKDTDPILFIDASEDIEQARAKSTLRKELETDRILQTLRSRKEVKNYAALVSLKTIAENDYNLNILRYIEREKEYEAVDEENILKRISEINQRISEIDIEKNKILKKRS